MFRWLPLFLLLVSCAPSVSRPAGPTPLLVSSFPRGVAWADGRNVWLLQGPRFELEQETMPAPVSGLAWWNEDLYASLPASHWVMRVQGVSDIRPLGRARALSKNLVYLENGEVLTPTGTLTSYRFPGHIQSVLSVDSTDFVLADGKLWRLAEGKAALVRNTRGPYLYAVQGGVQAAAVPTLQILNKTFTFENQEASLKDVDGTVLKTWALKQQRECNWGVVYDQVMLVCKDGFFQRFDLDLNPLGGSQ